MNRRVYIFSGGEIASGCALYLHHAGFLVVVSDRLQPSTVRRQISFSTAITNGKAQVEGTWGVYCRTYDEIQQVHQEHKIAVIVDVDREILKKFNPDIIVDATISKCNTLNMAKDMAPLTIGLGPELEAGVNTHVVVETDRGHNLGRLIFSGKAAPDTHEPGNIAGYSKERVLRCEGVGVWKTTHQIGDRVEKDELIGMVGSTELRAAVGGIIRGLLTDGFECKRPMFKCGDVDPRADPSFIYSVTDKTRCIAGAVLLASI